MSHSVLGTVSNAIKNIGSELHGEINTLRDKAEELLTHHSNHREWKNGMKWKAGDIAFVHDDDSREDEIYAIQY